MKKFLLIGAVLMVGACIYGFVDYSKARHSKRFSDLYQDTETKEQPVLQPATSEEAKILPGSKTGTSDVQKEAVKNSNAARPAIVKKPVKQKIQKPRKITYKSFSRAPLRETVTEKNISIESPKKETPKAKEQ